ncbi:hypothetical protein CJF42_00335 [Pseudoalteromonas sp. NBT06-2]|uniref:hypothetical protein n=1 Tax=Pseudoalteromonas sp. NBT06-2 TaxID=2025950 RepID=UPI000BA6CB4D|nr:hypothetical protein [Pseudoalteromonas sp. NBT06-2]PAJ76382.1 hypothetical protein CJF42_00335 [Pseudoalteromonas sp. NBT06-2]
MEQAYLSLELIIDACNIRNLADVEVKVAHDALVALKVLAHIQAQQEESHYYKFLSMQAQLE